MELEIFRCSGRVVSPARPWSGGVAMFAVNDLVLVTRNTDDFDPFDELRVANWFKTAGK